MTKIISWAENDRANGTRILGGRESEVHPKRDKCSWFGRSKTRDDSKCEEGRQRQNHSLSWKAKDEQCIETVVGKTVCSARRSGEEVDKSCIH